MTPPCVTPWIPALCSVRGEGGVCPDPCQCGRRTSDLASGSLGMKNFEVRSIESQKSVSPCAETFIRSILGLLCIFRHACFDGSGLQWPSISRSLCNVWHPGFHGSGLWWASCHSSIVTGSQSFNPCNIHSLHFEPRAFLDPHFPIVQNRRPLLLVSFPKKAW